MNAHLIELIDLEIGKLTAAREVLLGSPNQSNSSRESVTVETLPNGVDANEFPNIRTTNGNGHKPTLVLEKRKVGGGGMSEAGRARVAAAQKARWAKINARKKKTSRVA